MAGIFWNDFKFSPKQNNQKNHVSCWFLFSKTISWKKINFKLWRQASKSFLFQVSVEQTESYVVILWEGKRPVSKAMFLCLGNYPRTVSLRPLHTLNLKNRALLSAPSLFSFRRNWIVLQKVKWKGFFISKLRRDYPKRQTESLRQFCKRSNKLNLDLKDGHRIARKLASYF